MARQTINPDGFLRGCGLALIMATLIAASVGRWWPFGTGFPALVGGTLAGVAIAFLFVPWRWIDGLRQHMRSLERLAAHARNVVDPVEGTVRSAGPLDDANLNSIAEALASLAEQRRGLELELVQSRRNRDTQVAHETRRATASLRKQAATDVLTGLANRRMIELWVDALAAGSGRAGSIVAVAAIDLDHFKPINDTLGHETGDSCLRFLGQLLRSHMRGNDCAVRLGGDEFVLLMHADVREAQKLSERLRALFGQMPWSHKTIARPGLSIGIATGSVSDMHDMNVLLRKADEALYEAKQSGRGRTMIAPARRAVA